MELTRSRVRVRNAANASNNRNVLNVLLLRVLLVHGRDESGGEGEGVPVTQAKGSCRSSLFHSTAAAVQTAFTHAHKLLY